MAVAELDKHYQNINLTLSKPSQLGFDVCSSSSLRLRERVWLSMVGVQFHFLDCTFSTNYKQFTLVLNQYHIGNVTFQSSSLSIDDVLSISFQVQSLKLDKLILSIVIIRVMYATFKISFYKSDISMVFLFNSFSFWLLQILEIASSSPWSIYWIRYLSFARCLHFRTCPDGLDATLFFFQFFHKSFFISKNLQLLGVLVILYITTLFSC